MRKKESMYRPPPIVLKDKFQKVEFACHVYPECKMEDDTKPPSLIYIPSPEVMRKMIKACIKVDKPSDVFNKL